MAKRKKPGAPSPAEIRKARAAAGLTQAAAAELIYSATRTWEDWEAGVADMHKAFFELFLIKTGQLGHRRRE